MSSTLTPDIEAKLDRLKQVDFIIGVPSFNSERTIGDVIEIVAEGLAEYFPDGRSLILISDGGSTDKTRETASQPRLPSKVERIVGTYTGLSGKGSAVRLILEAAKLLKAKAVAIVDSDLRSIMPEWIDLLLRPVAEDGGLTTPLYLRYKYDGFITNQIVYPFTRAVYGKDVRQPIGGEFGMSQGLVGSLLSSPLWKNPYTPRFGIDIFITHTAISLGFPIREAFLGVKIHEAKDPTRHLTPMFRQVVGSMFSALELYEPVWRKIEESESIPIIRSSFKAQEPKSFPVDGRSPTKVFKKGFDQYRSLFESVMPVDLFDDLSSIASRCIKDYRFPIELWAKTAYVFASAFKREREREKRDNLLDALRICWSGRVGSFIRETGDLGNRQADEKVIEDSRAFKELKSFLLRIY